MAATFDRTDREWQELEAPLLDVDSELNIFALANGVDLLRNQSRLPDRTLEWYRDGMERRVRIRADGSGGYRVTVEASRKRKDSEPLETTAELAGPLGPEKLREMLRTLLADGVEAANALSRDDLSPAG